MRAETNPGVTRRTIDPRPHAEPTQLAIRAANQDDLAFIVALQHANRESVGHLPNPAIEERIGRGTIALAFLNDEPCGYFLYDYRGGVMRVPQACIHYDARRVNHGRALYFWALQGKNVAEVRVRCAADLEANLFWRALGFDCVDVRRGGIRRGRLINIWARWFEARLFGLHALAVSPAAQVRCDAMYDDTDFIRDDVVGFQPMQRLPKLSWRTKTDGYSSMTGSD